MFPFDEKKDKENINFFITIISDYKYNNPFLRIGLK